MNNALFNYFVGVVITMRAVMRAVDLLATYLIAIAIVIATIFTANLILSSGDVVTAEPTLYYSWDQLNQCSTVNDPNKPIAGYFHDGKHIYFNIGFEINRLWGANAEIEKIELIANNGIFAKQRVLTPPTSEVPTLHFFNNLVMYGENFDRIGNRLTLRENIVPENVLLFLVEPLSREILNSYEFNHFTMTFRAAITFSNEIVEEFEVTMSPIDFFGLIID